MTAKPYASDHTPPPPPLQHSGPTTDYEKGDIATHTPPVPRYGTSGNGTAATNTEALTTFADNLSPLIDIVGHAQILVSATVVAPGAFYDAYDFKGAVTTKLVGPYSGVFAELGKGLTTFQATTRKIISTYKTTDDLNNLSVADLTNLLYPVSVYFNDMMTVNGAKSS